MLLVLVWQATDENIAYRRGIIYAGNMTCAELREARHLRNRRSRADPSARQII